MITNAIEKLNNRKGSTLSAIRNFIVREYSREMNKTLQNHIKKFLAKEFEEGRIRMVNSDNEAINYKMRFSMTK